MDPRVCRDQGQDAERGPSWFMRTVGVTSLVVHGPWNILDAFFRCPAGRRTIKLSLEGSFWSGLFLDMLLLWGQRWFRGLTVQTGHQVPSVQFTYAGVFSTPVPSPLGVGWEESTHLKENH